MELDNRGLTPPEPMIRILSAIEELAPGEPLIVLMDRRPIPLLPILDQRGMACEMTDLPEGGVRLVITRK
jgi:uncharacterized protein (DUF2249 family)